MPPPSNLQTPQPGPNRGTGLVDSVNVGIHVRRYLKILARRWWIFILCVLAGTGYSAYKAYKTPDMYRAATIISVAPRLRTVYATQVEYQEALDNFYEENLNLIRSIVKDRAETKYAQRNPMAPMPPVYPGAAKQASSFLLSVDSPDLNAAKVYLTNWAREFIAYKNEVKDNTVAREAARVQDDIVRYTHKLEEARANKEAFLRTNKIGSPSETGAAAQKRYDQAIDKYREIQTQLKLERQRSSKDIAEGATASSRPAPPGDAKASGADMEDPLARFASESKYSELKLRIRSEQSELEQRRATLKPNHPYMKMVTARIAQLQLDIQHQLDLIQEKREARIKYLEQQEVQYGALKDQLLEDVQAKSAISYEYDRLIKDESAIEKYLQDLQRQMLAFDKSSIDESQFTIVQQGIPQASPAMPNRHKMILQGFFFGMVLGIGLVYFLHRLDDRLELAADIEEALQEPVLGQVPQVEARGMKNRCILITNLDQYSFFAEAIRGVRSAVMMGTQGGRKQVMLVSSAVPGDGKTTFTVNFAATLALAGHNVLLVDADLRRGNTHNYFKQDREPGLSEILAGEAHWDDLVKDTGVNSLQVINSGRLPANPGELLLSPIMKQFVEEAREKFDYIIVDCPPLTAIDDAFSMVGYSDGLLFVVRAGQTSMRFAQAALAAVRQRGANLLGIVLNGITADNPYYYYNTYYHSYYTKTDEAGSKPLSSARPGAKMPARRGRVAGGSIAAEAKALSGEPLESVETEAQRKAEEYRRLRARKTGETSFQKKPAGDPPPNA